MLTVLQSTRVSVAVVPYAVRSLSETRVSFARAQVWMNGSRRGLDIYTLHLSFVLKEMCMGKQGI